MLVDFITGNASGLGLEKDFEQTVYDMMAGGFYKGVHHKSSGKSGCTSFGYESGGAEIEFRNWTRKEILLEIVRHGTG
ncbi:MAG: hypothetical protein ACLVG5_03795 [Clostridium sp.]